MRYFERLRMSLRLKNSRCGKQAEYHTFLGGTHRYLCDEHYKEPRKRVLDGEFIMQLSYGETMGCDHEIAL